jgi:hypothetical protein
MVERTRMRILSIVISLLSLSPCLFAGAFFANTVLKNVPASAVASFLKVKGYSAFVIVDTADNAFVLVAERNSESEGPTEFNRLQADLTTEFKGNALTCFVADSDVLYLSIYDRGEKVFEYNSDPGYGVGPAREPEIFQVDRLVEIYKCPKTAFLEFSKASKVKSYVFAEELQADIYKLLGIPGWVIGIGYSSMKEDVSLGSELKQQGKSIIEVP